MTVKKQTSPEAICPVDNAREALRTQLQQQAFSSRAIRQHIAQLLRLLTEISMGRGTPATLETLTKLLKQSRLPDASLNTKLLDSLKKDAQEWQNHVTRHSCSAESCFQPHYAPCQVACPAHIDIPSMIALVGQKEYAHSLSVLLKDSPLPSSCGLVCPAPCEDVCVQKTISSSVLIKPMKWVAARCAPEYPTPSKASATGKKIAIIGAGPAGLTAAYYLAQKGHQVDIFDEREQAGGIMRYGIPQYRLPEPILNAEIDMIRSLGVNIHTGHQVQNVREFKQKGFDATFIATGLQNSRNLGVPGEDQDFVLGGMDFLSDVRSGKNPRVGPHVIVIGGGNAAIDVAMTAFRQGATKVQMWYRRTRRDMPANPHEVEMALAEGVELVELWAPTQVLPNNQIEFSRSKNAPDAATAKPVTVHADHIIAGIGQEAHLGWLEGSDIKTEWGNIIVNPDTLETDESGVFAGGDIAHGASTVVAAIGSGKRAAEAMHAWLMKTPLNQEALLPQRRADVPCVPSQASTRTEATRPHVPEKDPGVRKFSHDFIQYDLDEAVAGKEAERCLRCDICIGCGLCELACIEMGVEALSMTQTPTGRLAFDDFVRPAERCIGCGACAAVCPTGAIKVETREGKRITEITGTIVRSQPLETCVSCHAPISAATHLGKTHQQVGKLLRPATLCANCSREYTAQSMQEMFVSPPAR